MNVSLPTTRFLPFDASTDRRRAALVLSAGLAAGAVTQALFWHAKLGLDFWLWDMLVLGGTVALLRRGRLPATAWGALVATALLGFSVVLYESEWTVILAVPATLLALGVLPLLVRDRYTLCTLSRLPGDALSSIGRAPGAIAEAARLPAAAAGDSSSVRSVLRGLAVGFPIAGFFTLLFLGDSDFARSLEHLRERVGDVVSFGVWSVVSAAGYLVGHFVHRRRAAAIAAPGGIPYRDTLVDLPLHAVPAARVSVTAWSMVIGQVSLVFALFVAANLRHLFGGVALVRAPGDLTYATYLHEGFGELLFATMLSLCLVLVGHRLLRPRGSDPSLPVPGARLLASLEGTLLVLTGVTLVSCWQRLRIYEDAYGASHLRLGVAFIELSVLGVLALTLLKVVRRSWTGHGGAVLTLATAIAVFACGLNTDAYIAKRNLDRAAAGKPLDVEYLESLSRDAASALGHPYLRSHPQVAGRLVAAYCAPKQQTVRGYRGLFACDGGDR